MPARRAWQRPEVAALKDEAEKSQEALAAARVPDDAAKQTSASRGRASGSCKASRRQRVTPSFKAPGERDGGAKAEAAQTAEAADGAVRGGPRREAGAAPRKPPRPRGGRHGDGGLDAEERPRGREAPRARADSPPRAVLGRRRRRPPHVGRRGVFGLRQPMQLPVPRPASPTRRPPRATRARTPRRARRQRRGSAPEPNSPRTPRRRRGGGPLAARGDAAAAAAAGEPRVDTALAAGERASATPPPGRPTRPRRRGADDASGAPPPLPSTKTVTRRPLPHRRDGRARGRRRRAGGTAPRS